MYLHYSSSNCTVVVFWQFVGKIVVVPPVVPQIPPPAKKEAAVKPAAAMGRRLSRSSTFSCVDTKSQAAKVTYGKKLAKTVEDLPAPKETDSQTGNFNPAQSGKIHSWLYLLSPILTIQRYIPGYAERTRWSLVILFGYIL